MKLVLSGITILYPLLIYGSLRYGSPYTVLFIVGSIVALRSYMSCRERLSLVTTLSVSLGITLAVVALCSIGTHVPLLLPFVTNLFLLGIFSLSLIYPPSVIERVAVRMKGELPPEGIRHCHTVCQVWIVFFALNALVSLDSAFRSLEWWSLYNGLISYCLAGAIFAVEYFVRRRVIKRVALHTTLAALIGGAIIALSGPSAHAQQLTIDRLQEKLTPPGPFRAQFSEKRFVAVLSAPLESSGELRCIPQVGLVWETTAPVRRTALITPQGIRHVRQGDRPRLTVDHAGVSEALLSLMSGDIAHAQENFVIEAGGTAQEWRIVLTPRDTLVAEVIRSISVFGGERPQGIEVSHANGDRIVTSFGSPIALLPDEMAQARDILRTTDD